MEVTRLFDLLDYQAKHTPKPDALSGKENGQWVKYSTSEVIKHAGAISYGLLALGIGRDDKVANISNNRPEWHFADFGMMQIGAVHVPVYPTISEDDYRFILNDAAVKVVFVSDKSLFEKITNIRKDVPSIQEVYTFDRVPGAKHWTELAELGKSKEDAGYLEGIKRSISAEDMATLLYTSGTTGVPKGVMLTHSNIVSNVWASRNLTPCDHRHRALSFLPLCHIYERMLTYLNIYKGVSVYYAESLEKIVDNIKEVKPHLFSTVPRLLEKVYDKIVAKGKELTGVKKALFFWALALGDRYELNGANGWWYELQLKIANKLIFNKWREALGGNILTMVSGGAALQPRLARVFWAAQLPVLQGYGLTETSPVIAVNTLEPGGSMLGTVGPVLENVKVKIAADGEILCKGPNVMKGYYKRPDLTAEVIDADGWFHTGDIGELVDNRFLKITDRKKEIFKTSGGKYVAPQMVENVMKESPFIEQIMVVGEGQKFVSALVVPAFEYVKGWCALKGIEYTSNAEIIKNSELINKIKSEIDEKNKRLGHVEQVKRFELLPAEWSAVSGEMTPKLSLKRKVIADKNKETLNRIYRVEE
jgi:long-chain acyl-CoA synthetase